jgi:4-aminobutyrate aminotransferase-like enzyme/Ser/Thr protein kinase RdoA (MazF antagonist)/murein DD-endopeptidase MepM/ murein hydrolase activator NlpD
VTTAPQFTAEEAEWLARVSYNLRGRATPLTSERDQNFLLESGDGRLAVLKLANAQEREAYLDLENKVMAHLSAAVPEISVSRPIADREGRLLAPTQSSAGARHFVRVVSHVAGKRLAEVRPHSADLLHSLGATLARVDVALAGFVHPALPRDFHWDLLRTAEMRGRTGRIGDEKRRAQLERLLDGFMERALPGLLALPRQAIYNDANDGNILVSGAAGARRVTGLVDFGDMVVAPAICDLAVAAAYAMLGKADPVTAALHVVSGYHTVRPVSEEEVRLLPELILARLCLSVTISAWQQPAAPDNTYLRASEDAAWKMLDGLETESRRWMEYRFREACGQEACPRAVAVRRWLHESAAGFAAVVQPDPRRAALRILDLSAASKELETSTSPADEPAFARFVQGAMERAGAAIGVGRYDEARLCYRGAQFAQAGENGPEWRTVHIGMDLFQPAGSAVFAPIAGKVHSFADNALPFDYGPTIILQHDAGGVPFYTLYGHLSRESLRGMEEGKPVAAGEKIGAMGEPAVNGGWPPHLHFQIICDLLEKRGDVPGVCAPGERAVWRSLCPDPNLMLRIPPEKFPAPPRDKAALLVARRERVGPSLRWSYRNPLHIVRGYRQHLWDAEGRIYLDAINNVPHVGHCHPHVVEAIACQAARLATNTRYLYAGLAEYTERLTATLPAPLRVCYLVNSGSEANELALRLARAATGRRGVVAVEGGYHGNTTSLVEISHYKFAGPGGAGRAAHVHVAPMPDTYRGAHGAGDPAAGPKYAQLVGEACERAAAAGFPAGAFIFESLPGTGGMIVPPAGFLGEAYRLARAAGAVCIADEVQVGFGRVGSHVWGFEAVGGQGVVPDIVTLGKPIGNGFPLGAVVTTREIADAFANGMEYFSTFGGNPVACAAGLAVLDVMREEKLQENARFAGEQLLAGLRALQQGFPLIGEVRGMGLFIGAELVRDPATREAAAEEASYIAERLRERGVLISTDGPLHNVLKIRPPLCFEAKDASRLLAALRETCGEF